MGMLPLEQLQAQLEILKKKVLNILTQNLTQ